MSGSSRFHPTEAGIERVHYSGSGPTLGRTTTLPAADAHGIGTHTATTGDVSIGYYANDLVATQTQAGRTLGFSLDPTQTRFIDTTDTTGTATTTNHYADSGDSPAWTSTSATAWTRNLTGIAGGLAGTIDQTGTVTLDLANMHGDIIATCPDDTSTTGISSYSESTEYGAPREATTAADTYGWLGTKQRSTNDLAGLTLMGVRLYNPTTGRFLSVDPVPGGNDNPYVYVNNPTDQFDLNGQWGHWRRWFHRAFWGTVSFFSARGYISGTWALTHRHYRSAWNSFLGVAPTGGGSAGLAYGGRPGAHRNTFSGTFKRFARGAVGRTAGRLLGWPVTVGATALDYGHSWWNAPRRRTHNINGYRNARGQVF
jgi:RHS repeat-associated protein